MHSDIQFLTELLESAPTEPPLALISEYAETHRVLPVNTPFPGLWDNSKTPYLVEPMNNMAPSSGIQHTVMMAGAQLGKSAMAENVVAYYMGECPAEQLFISATDTALGKWLKRLEPLIDSCGIREMLIAIATNTGSRRTGDTSREKQYPGGTLSMASAQSASSLRADTIRVLIRDEIDGAPELLKTGEGSWLKVSYARTSNWGERKRVLDVSTPTTIENSVIYPLFLSGDQRKYFVPCPLCGEYQYLQSGNEQSNYGLKAETEDGVIVCGYYQCEFCQKAIFNHQKTEMLAGGEWRPMVTGKRDIRSYHLPSYYSPVGMLSWTEIVKERAEAEETPDGMRSFVNLREGWPYKEPGHRPKWENVVRLRGAYKAETIQSGTLFLTGFVDVQSGSKKDKANPARLEMEICGIGAGYRTWSVIYKRFEGSVEDPYAGAWQDLYDWIEDGNMTFSRDDGMKFSPKMLLIDSGDGNLMDVVYKFCERKDGVFPSKGFNALKIRKNEKGGDEFGASNHKRFRAVNIGTGNTLYEISTNFYKGHVYRNLNLERQALDPQPPGFCDFPKTYPDDYFKGLTAEEQRRDGSFHCPSGRRNEPLDCRVGCMCAADILLDIELENWKLREKQRGVSTLEIKQRCTLRAVIDGLATQLAMKNPKATK